jgi:hypothetical protein
MPYGPPPRGFRPAKDSRAKEPRAKPVRITVDLAPADYQVLNSWLARAGVDLDQPVSRVTLARAIGAMIRATAADHVVNDIVLDLLRKEQS